MGETVAAMGAALAIPMEPFQSCMDDNIKPLEELVGLVDMLLGAGNLKGEISFLLRSNLGAKNVDGQVKFSNELTNYGFFGLTFGKVEVDFLGNHFAGPFISSEPMPWFWGSF